MGAPGVVVVGAGIVGASIAYHLAARGQDVTLVDAGLPAGGSTGASFAWIGRPAWSDLPSAPLRYLAVDEYHRLERELPELEVHWSGALTWGAETTGPGADAAAIEPGLARPPHAATHLPDDGASDPVAATEALVRAAVAHGARLHVGTPVIALERRGDAVVGVRTLPGTLAAATVVLAAGTGTVALASTVGLEVQVRSSPAVLVRMRAEPGLLRTVVSGPELEARQAPDGTLLVPVDHTGETDRLALSRTGRRVRDRVAALLHGADGVEVLSVEIGWRPMPADGEPIVGFESRPSGLYLAVMHSGITLAAAVGRLAAEEIAGGEEAAELAGCRSARFGPRSAT